MRTLITFLGKGRRDEGGYRPANYLFSGGTVRTTPYFGLALLDELRDTGRPVDHLVVLGTSSSIWGALLGGEMRDAELWCELSEREDRDAVDEDLLARVADDVGEAMKPRGVSKVSLRLIPFGRDEEEQMDILETMSSSVSPGDSLVMDVSHGFRHLPMLGILSGLFLKLQRDVRVGEVYYAALDMTTPPPESYTPVLRLDGLLRLGEWLAALGGYRRSGDYGVFAPLVEQADPETADLLCQTSFSEKILDTARARKKLKKARSRFAAIAAKDRVFRLVAPELDKMCAWAEQPRHYLRQLAAARAALEIGNYVRAASLGIEAIISARLAAHGGNAQGRAGREEMRKRLNEESRGDVTRLDGPQRLYVALREVRNALAHGSRPSRNDLGEQTALASEKNLRRYLRDRLDEAWRLMSS